MHGGRSSGRGAGGGPVPEVSVLIPTWNRASSVDRAVRSALGQTHRSLELLVIDDGSNDGTLALLAGVEDPRMRVLTGPRRGVSAARNLGIARSRGAWIALLDSDDWWLAEKLERQLQALESEPSLLLCHCDEIWVRDGVRVNPRRIHRKRGGLIFEHCLPRCAISPSSAVIHRSLLESLGTFDETMPACEDYDLWLRVCARHPVLFLDQQLVIKTGGHADQLSRTVKAQDRYRIRAIAKLLRAGDLGAGEARAAAETLRRKIEVYRAGALKRGRLAEVEELEALDRDLAAPILSAASADRDR
ncbi:MAG: glycosyltransferase [Acidobacteriota bacterium]